MQFTINTILLTASTVLSFASCAAINNPAADADAAAAANKWAFKIYQDASCNPAAGNITQSGTGSTGCGPPLEYHFGSVLVSANGGGNCVIGFYTGAGGNGQCNGLVAKTPNTIKVGTCYTFSSGTPQTYGVTCS